MIVRYLLNWLIWLDEGISTLTLGDPGETISSRLGKARKAGSKIGTVLANALDFVALHVFGQSDHCNKSIEVYEGSRKLIEF